MATVEMDTSCGQGCKGEAKFACLIDDVVTPCPRRKIPVSLLRALTGLAEEFVIVRDHNSPNDVVLKDDVEIDLAQGNVFYRLKRCEVQPRGPCNEPPKFAFFVDDRAEITTRGELTGQVLRELFALAPHALLVRDYESPRDEAIELETKVNFVDGPVFYSRHVESQLKITVNVRVYTEHEGVKPQMTGLAIAALAFPSNPQDTTVRFVSEGNRAVSHSETILIRGCEEFEVCRKDVTGGYEQSRVERELAELRHGGGRVTLVKPPTNAVVYHDLQARRGSEVTGTDVLVPIPSGYPGCLIDWAYLPENSPLIGKVKGSPQEPRIAALGKTWRQISYHPHKGGGAEEWNPNIHGFHTYLGEIISWLCNQQ